MDHSALDLQQLTDLMDVCEVPDWDLVDSGSSDENFAYTVSQTYFPSICLVKMASPLTLDFDQRNQKEVYTSWYPLKMAKFHF